MMMVKTTSLGHCHTWNDGNIVTHLGLSLMRPVSQSEEGRQDPANQELGQEIAGMSSVILTDGDMIADIMS